MIDPELLEILRCPADGGKLHPASDKQVERLNEAIRSGDARDRVEQRVEQTIEGGLVTTDGRWLYPIRDRIPTLVVDEAIELKQP